MDNEIEAAERLETVCQMARELTMLRDETAIIQRALETASRVLGSEATACGLVVEASGELEYRYPADAGPGGSGPRLSLDGDRGLQCR